MKALRRVAPLTRLLQVLFGKRTFKVRYDGERQAFVPLPMTQGQVRAYPKSQFELAHYQAELELFRDSDSKKVDGKYKAGDQHWATYDFKATIFPDPSKKIEDLLHQKEGYFDNSEIVRFVVNTGIKDMFLFGPPRFGKTTALTMLQAFFGIPFKDKKVDQQKMRFYAECFERLNICKNSTKQEWEKYKRQHMHKYVVFFVAPDDFQTTKTQQQFRRSFVNIFKDELSQIGATTDQLNQLQQSTNCSMLARKLAKVLKMNSITQQHRPIILIDQSNKVFQNVKQYYRLSSNQAQRKHLLGVYNAFVGFLNQMTKKEKIDCIVAGTQPISQYQTTRLNNFQYFRSYDLYKYFLPTTEQFQKKIKKDFPQSATSHELKLIARLFNGYQRQGTSYTSLHAAYQLLCSSDSKQYIAKDSRTVSSHFRLLMEHNKKDLKEIFQLSTSGIRVQIVSSVKSQFSQVITSLKLSRQELANELVNEELMIVNKEGTTCYLKPLDLQKAFVVRHLLTGEFPNSLYQDIFTKLSHAILDRSSLSLSKLQTICRIVSLALKNLGPLPNQKKDAQKMDQLKCRVNNEADMAAALGLGFSILTNHLLHQQKACGATDSGIMDNMLFSFNREQAAIFQYKYLEDGKQSPLQGQVDKAFRQVFNGFSTSSAYGKQKPKQLAQFLQKQSSELTLTPYSYISRFEKEQLVKRVFVAGVAMNSNADCSWTILELELLREAGQLRVKKVGQNKGSTLEVSGKRTTTKKAKGPE